MTYSDLIACLYPVDSGEFRMTFSLMMELVTNILIIMTYQKGIKIGE